MKLFFIFTVAMFLTCWNISAVAGVSSGIDQLTKRDDIIKKIKKGDIVFLNYSRGEIFGVVTRMMSSGRFDVDGQPAPIGFIQAYRKVDGGKIISFSGIPMTFPRKYLELGTYQGELPSLDAGAELYVPHFMESVLTSGAPEGVRMAVVLPNREMYLSDPYHLGNGYPSNTEPHPKYNEIVAKSDKECLQGYCKGQEFFTVDDGLSWVYGGWAKRFEYGRITQLFVDDEKDPEKEDVHFTIVSSSDGRPISSRPDFLLIKLDDDYEMINRRDNIRIVIGRQYSNNHTRGNEPNCTALHFFKTKETWIGRSAKEFVGVDCDGNQFLIDPNWLSEKIDPDHWGIES